MNVRSIFCLVAITISSYCSAVNVTVPVSNVTDPAINVTTSAATVTTSAAAVTTSTTVTTVATVTASPVDTINAAVESALAHLQQRPPWIAAPASANDAASAMSSNPGYLCRFEYRLGTSSSSFSVHYTSSFCAGTLINAKTVLTAGLCVGTVVKNFLQLYNGNGKFNIVCGDVDSRWQSNGDTRKSIQFDLSTDRITHPKSYDKGQAEDSAGSSKPYNLDMALLHLSQSFKLNSQTKPFSAKISISGATGGSTQKVSNLEATTDTETKSTGTQYESNTVWRYASDSVAFEASCPVSSSGLICYKRSSLSQARMTPGSPIILKNNKIGGIFTAESQDGTLVYAISDVWKFSKTGKFISQALQVWRSLFLFGK